MPPPSARSVQARASCVVIVAWRAPHPPCERVPGGSAQPPPSVSMNKANLSVASAAWAGLGLRAPDCPSALWVWHTQHRHIADYLGPQFIHLLLQAGPRLGERVIAPTATCAGTKVDWEAGS